MGADFDQISLTLRSGLDEPDYKAALTVMTIRYDGLEPIQNIRNEISGA